MYLQGVLQWHVSAPLYDGSFVGWYVHEWTLPSLTQPTSLPTS